MSYSPKLMRWIQEDPIGYLEGPNLYKGLGNSPINHVDPMGTTSRPATDPGESIPGGPTYWDHLNPLDILHGTFPYAPNTTWFERRFPKTVDAMKDNFKEAVETYIKNQRWGGPGQSGYDVLRYIPAEDFGYVIIGDESEYGDVPQSEWYMSHILGHYSYAIEGNPNLRGTRGGVRVVYRGTALCTNVYAYSFRLAIADELGISNQNGEVTKSLAFPIFWNRVVIRAVWDVEGQVLTGTQDRWRQHIEL